MSGRPGYRNHSQLASYRSSGYEQGYSDYEDGVRVCPYRDIPGSLLHRKYWHKGWKQAQADYENGHMRDTPLAQSVRSLHERLEEKP